MLLTFTGHHGLAARGRLGMSLNRRDIRMSDSTADQPAHEPASYPISPLRWRSAPQQFSLKSFGLRQLDGSHGSRFASSSPAYLTEADGRVSSMSEYEGLSDYFILRMYEFIRHEAQADTMEGTRLIGPTARRRAELLFSETERRGLFCKSIAWPEYLELGAEKSAPTVGLPKVI